ncbi:MAG TPA: thiamine-phosphate kinase [Candidatus Aenigmarchaeota archaeon]|nr:thiamine-phosphate kinase [Candidatus Aenigmarchaeota archaeon]
MAFSERSFIKQIEALTPTSMDGLIKGIGDDCAVLAKNRDQATLLTTDTLIESVHFDPAWHPPYLLGRKAAAVNISDIAAMGGQPRFPLLSVGVSAATEEGWLDQVMTGFQSMLEEHNMILIGGDTVSSPDLMFSVTVIGEMETEKVLYRSGARPGDLVWVSGPLGEAAAGLEICRSHEKECDRWPSLVKAHLDPRPEVELGQILSKSGMVNSMMDLSDGIATDLAHICTASSTGADIQAADIPFSENLLQTAAIFHLNPLDLALRGGEDYQLLFTSTPEHATSLPRLVRDQTGGEIFRVGRITSGKGVTLLDNDRRKDISFQGYEHGG